MARTKEWLDRTDMAVSADTTYGATTDRIRTRPFDFGIRRYAEQLRDQSGDSHNEKRDIVPLHLCKRSRRSGCFPLLIEPRMLQRTHLEYGEGPLVMLRKEFLHALNQTT